MRPGDPSPAGPRAPGWPFRPHGGPPHLVAHRGGGGEAPENTLEAFARAAAAGVAAIELDVAALAGGGLVVTHEEAAAASGVERLRLVAPAAPSFDEVLAWFAREAPGVVVHADVKPVGREEEVVAALRAHGLLGCAIVSSIHPASLRRFAQLAPGLPRAFGYPRDRHGATGYPLLAPAVAGALDCMRATLPLRAGRLLRAADATIAALERRVVSERAVTRCHALGYAVHVWTVDDPAEAARLATLGVDAIVTDTPTRLETARAATMPR